VERRNHRESGGFLVVPYMVGIGVWDVVEYRKRGVTAAIFLLGGRLGKSRVCEVWCKVLCQIYAKSE